MPQVYSIVEWNNHQTYNITNIPIEVASVTLAKLTWG